MRDGFGCETQVDEFNQSCDGETSLQKFNHVLNGETGLLASHGQLCYDLRHVFVIHMVGLTLSLGFYSSTQGGHS